MAEASLKAGGFPETRREPLLQLRIWGSAVGCPSGVHGGAPGDVGFGVFWSFKNHKVAF